MAKDLSNLSAKEFVEWLAQEGVGGVAVVREQYEALPWRLRLAWWAVLSSKMGWFENMVSDGFLRENEGDFWFAIQETAYLGEQPGAWSVADNFIRGHLTGESNQKFLAALNDKDGGASEREFERFREEASRILEKSKWVEPDPSDKEGWDTLWLTHGPDVRIIKSPNVPVECLERWRKRPHFKDPDMDMDDYILFHAVSGRPSIPNGWEEELVSQQEADGDNWSLLQLYLGRPDISMDFRRRFRKEARSITVLRAAWSCGECTDEELAGLEEYEWANLAWRDDIDERIARGLLKYAPHINDNWVKKEGLSSQVRLLVIQSGHGISWRNESEVSVLLAGLDLEQGELLNMADSARREWGQEILEKLLHLVLEIPETSVGAIRRLVYLGDVIIDRALLKKLLGSSNQSIRLLGSEWLGRISQAKHGSIKR